MNDAIPREDESMESLVAEATNEFMDRVRRGELWDVEPCACRYPLIAGILRQLLPAMQSMHQSSADSAARKAAVAGVPEPLGCLGNFQLLREIGRGGMGVVYEAKQISLGRRVALKVLPLAAALDPRQLQRFRLEAQAAAHLHHSHIVPIYSVGCERSVHFYAMQYIEGQSLAELILEMGHVEATLRAATVRERSRFPGPPAPLRSRLGVAGAGERPELPATTVWPSQEAGVETAEAAATAQSLRHSGYFQAVAAIGIQAAEALDYAHGMGVVHRDIKPGNLLLDAQRNIYVTDFGLAQLQGVTGPTMTGDQVGTLRYMSPEQALSQHGVVDHRTDIYSLGATLYELLTLAPAFSAPGRHALLRQIAEEEPLAPRQRNQAVPVDLETIVLKAMAKEPQRRYATAKELADDLKRFLEHRPILARRPTLVERAAKWSRRHRALVGSAAAVLLLAAVGFAASTLLIARAQWKTQAAYDQLTAEQARTKTAHEAEAEQRARAEMAFRQAREAVDFLTELTEAELANKPELQELRRKLLQAALDYYRDFIAEHGDDPSIQAELAESHFRVAGILDQIGSKAEAQVAFERARQIEEKLPPEHRFPFPFGKGHPWGLGFPGTSHDGHLVLLLAHKPVQEELRLSAEQAKKAGQLAKANVACKLLEDVGQPAEKILLEAQRYDLVVLGKQTYYHFETQSEPDQTLVHVLKNSPRPVVTVPEQLTEGGPVVVAYDGSLQAARKRRRSPCFCITDLQRLSEHGWRCCDHTTLDPGRCCRCDRHDGGQPLRHSPRRRRGAKAPRPAVLGRHHARSSRNGHARDIQLDRVVLPRPRRYQRRRFDRFGLHPGLDHRPLSVLDGSRASRRAAGRNLAPCPDGHRLGNRSPVDA